MKSMIKENIWENLQLDKEYNQESAYDLLMTQADNLTQVTKSELIMEVETFTRIVGSDNEYGNVYILYVVAPNLGNFRKQILSVVEYYNIGKFPVEIHSYIENTTILNIQKKDFLKEIKKILSQNVVQQVISILYRQSLDAKKYIS